MGLCGGTGTEDENTATLGIRLTGAVIEDFSVVQRDVLRERDKDSAADRSGSDAGGRIVLNGAVDKGSEAGTGVGVENCRSAAVAIGGVIIGNQAVGHREVGVAGAGDRAAGVIVESAAKSILQTAEVPAVVPELDYEIRDAHRGIGECGYILVEGKYLIDSGAGADARLNDAGRVAAAIHRTYYVDGIRNVQGPVRGGKIVGQARLCKCVGSRNQLNGVCAERIVGFSYRLTQTAGGADVDVADVIAGCGNRPWRGIVEAIDKKSRVRQRHHHGRGHLARVQCDDAGASVNIDPLGQGRDR